MTSKWDKILLGAAGTVGAGLASWRVFVPWIGYDLKMIRYGRKLKNLTQNDAKNGRFIINMFEEAVLRHPRKAFVIFEDRIYTYGFMNDQANKVANIAMNWGLRVGECIAIMMENEPAFIWTFLGMVSTCSQIRIALILLLLTFKSGKHEHFTVRLKLTYRSKSRRIGQTDFKGVSTKYTI